MTTLPHDPPVTPESIKLAQQAQDSMRVEALVDFAKTFEDTDLSFADEQELRRWFARAYVASRKSGRYALLEAKARKLAEDQIRLMVQEDEASGDAYNRADRAVHHFQRSLRLYLRMLEGEPLSLPDAPVWHYVASQGHDGETIMAGYVCPECWPKESHRRFDTVRELGQAASRDARYFGCHFCGDVGVV